MPEGGSLLIWIYFKINNVSDGMPDMHGWIKDYKKKEFENIGIWITKCATT